MKITLSIFCLALAAGLTSAQCPCTTDGGTLTCQPGIINRFPEDIFAVATAECPIDPATIWNIQLAEQPVTELGPDAFRDFVASGLYAVAFEFGSLQIIRKDAFRGLENSLKEIYMKNNQLSQIEDGAFDGLVRLKVLDVRDNLTPDNSTIYTTQSWNFCHRVAGENLFVQGDVKFYQDLQSQPQELNDLYCQSWPTILTCRVDGTQADCSGMTPQQVGDNICNLKKQVTSNGVSSIVIDFPMDQVLGQVEEFYEGASGSFFQTFNAYGSAQDMSYTKLKSSLTLYGTKFDLASLIELTSDRTKEVTIKADTIHISQPMSIHYQLRLLARVVAITQPITMNMTSTGVFGLAGVEPWTYSEKLVYLDEGLTMRERKFGLVEILEEDIVRSFDKICCEPAVLPATVEKLSPLMDMTHVNLNFICGRTLFSAGSNPGLTNTLTDFFLRLLRNSTLVGSQQLFNAAKKFKRLNQLASMPNTVHNVPAYALPTINELSKNLHTSMEYYRQNEAQQELQLFISSQNMAQMMQHFSMAEQEQERYFAMEMSQLEAIWADSSTQWNFDFNHRNEIQANINDALNAQSELMFQMQEQQYKEMLAEAEASVIHMSEVVDKYQGQVDRMLEKAKGSMEVQSFLVSELKKNADNVDHLSKKFKHDAEAWAAAQIVKGFLGIIFSFGAALLGKYDEVANQVQAAVEAGIKIAEIMEELVDVLEKIEDIEDIIANIDVGDIGGVTESMSTEFSIALQNAVDVKMKGPRFDEFESTAIITMDTVNAETDYGIDSAPELMCALKSVSDVGKRVVDEVSSFADTILQLAERQDELKVAIADKERAVAEVERISTMITDLLEAKRLFEEDRLAAQAAYEAKIEEMRLQYEQMTEELRNKFRQEITQLYDDFKARFNQGKQNYLTSINDLMDAIHVKSLGLKDHSMNQRAMILALYTDFCETQFYHSFTQCTPSQTPLMSDDFDTLLKKLNDIEWNTITSTDNLPDKPNVFGEPTRVKITITDRNVTNMSMPVAVLKNNSRTEINLFKSDELHNFDKFWRVRISKIRVVLLDESDVPIPSPGTEFGGYIQVRITFPTIFNDTSLDHRSHSFMAQDYFCAADYFTQNGVPNFVSECAIDSDFSDYNYKPAPDGQFTIKLANADQIDVQRIAKLAVEFAGSYIPRDSKNMEWINN